MRMMLSYPQHADMTLYHNLYGRSVNTENHAAKDSAAPDGPWTDGNNLIHIQSNMTQIGPTRYEHCLKSQVVLLQTAHSWANAGVLLGARMHRERDSFRSN